MVEIRWTLKQGGQAIDLLPSIAAFCRLAARAAEGNPGAEGAVVTIGLSLHGVHVARDDEGTTVAVEQIWARRTVAPEQSTVLAMSV